MMTTATTTPPVVARERKRLATAFMARRSADQSLRAAHEEFGRPSSKVERIAQRVLNNTPEGGASRTTLRTAMPISDRQDFDEALRLLVACGVARVVPATDGRQGFRVYLATPRR